MWGITVVNLNHLSAKTTKRVSRNNISFGKDSIFILSKEFNVGENINRYIENLYTLSDW